MLDIGAIRAFLMETGEEEASCRCSPRFGRVCEDHSLAEWAKPPDLQLQLLLPNILYLLLGLLRVTFSSTHWHLDNMI